MGGGCKLYFYVTVIKKLINNIIECRKLKKSNVFVYKFKQHNITRTLPGDCC